MSPAPPNSMWKGRPERVCIGAILCPAGQLRLFADESPLVEELRGLHIASHSPLEAINKVFEWQERWGRM